VYKYNQYERRDGSVISVVLDKDGRMVADRNEVDKLIIDKLKEIQLVEKEPFYTEPIDFPKLSKLSDSSTLEILDTFYYGNPLTKLPLKEPQ